MGRHGYTDDNDDILQLGRWRGMVKSAIRGKRGQKLIRELAAALDAMPEKRLVSGSLQTKDGDCCAIGCIARVKGHDLTDREDDEECDLQEFNGHLAELLDVAECLVQEIEYENDEGAWKETPEQRWARMRRWCDKRLAPPLAGDAAAVRVTPSQEGRG